MKRERLLWATLLGASVLVNVVTFATPVSADVESYHTYQQILQNVFHRLRTMYVEEKDERALLIGAIRGMLAATGDPYTRFLDKTEHRQFNNAESGKKVGIGVEVTMRGGYPFVIAPVEGGPAARAGIRAGDRIMSINGTTTRRKSFGQIIKLIAGDIGSTVELGVRREGIREIVKIRVTRGLFNLEYVRGKFLDGGKIGYVRLLQFFGEESGSVEKFRNHLLKFKAKGVKGIVVDLRNNTGGHLEMAGVLSGFFLKPGQVVVSARGRGPNSKRVLRAGGSHAGIIPASIPVVVLINRGSASASEIMAGALQDHRRAKLLGTRSFGKASVQQIIRPLPDDTAALITIQKYYTPLNRSLHGVGLKPDIVVAGIKPSYDETYFLNKMRKTNFMREFRKRRPNYDKATAAAFITETAARGWKFSRPLAMLLLKTEYGLSGENLDTDPQLRRAIRELNGK